MKTTWVWAAILLFGCVESNPQPSPGARADISAASDTLEAMDTAADDSAAPMDAAEEIIAADTVCVPNCTDKECGDDDCDGSCGVCPTDEQWSCVESLCVCAPACEGKECGPDGCGWVCGDCGEGGVCIDGMCPCGCDLTDDMVATDQAMKLSVLEPGVGGYPGFALDIDGDPDTCAPPGDCQDGLDNSLGPESTQFVRGVSGSEDPDLLQLIEGEDFFLLAKPQEPSLDGSEFEIVLHIGSPVETQEVCDWQTESCDFTVDPESFSVVDCEPIFSFVGATIIDGHLTAGGPETVLSFTIPLNASDMIPVNLYMLQLQADVVLDGETVISLVDGVIGGALDKQEMLDACPELDNSQLELPVPPDILRMILDEALVPDIDRDGDGSLESVSFGLAFETIPASIVGITVD